MIYRQLGASGPEVSAIGFGAWQIGDPAYWGANDEADAQRTVDTALDAGVTLFDTAEMYGQGESKRVLGRALGARRGRVFVASKVWPSHCRPDLLEAACEASLSRLGTDYLDLYQVHWAPRDVPFSEVTGALERLRGAGKIRHFGISNFGVRDMQTWFATGDCVSNQLGYNLLFRAIELEILPACFQRGIGVLAYMPLMQGLLAGRWTSAEEVPMSRRRTRHFSALREGTRHGEAGCETETFEVLRAIQRISENAGAPTSSVALAWVMAQTGVSSVIVGARRPEQLAANLDATRLHLSADVLQALHEATAPLRDRLGANADMWLAGSDSRIR